MLHPVHAHLERLYREADHARYRAADPVAFVHRYHTRADQEIAAVFASALAFGRVDLFRPVLRALFDRMDRFGGPFAFVSELDAARARALDDLVYRWSRGPDLALLCAALQRAGPLEPLLQGPGGVRDRLRSALTALRRHATEALRAHGQPISDPAHLPRGLRFLLPDVDGGSGCKRWNLFLRWMVRPPREGVDLGLWSVLHPRDLIMPVDTHVGRIAQLLGLTARADGSWRTAEALTAALRAFDPEDPVRYDFALAHVGISEGCLGYRSPQVCPSCPLQEVCRAT
jgi:uncharacterized protein (TIGR02757 family)